MRQPTQWQSPAHTSNSSTPSEPHNRQATGTATTRSPVSARTDPSTSDIKPAYSAPVEVGSASHPWP
ncbi:hypothetical protein ACI2LO_29330 [Streptomyces sp. NPDC033754]|uniref:hypothetical protein n=1 Tax=unclassified Streptomyces TaxID=2593676 RepID=UPI0033EB841D